MTEADEIVYVVDDDPAVRKGLTRLLRSAGYEVTAFASAAEFLARDHQQGVGCIVLDVRMPGADGLALQSNLAAQGVDLPIVFLTGHGDRSHQGLSTSWGRAPDRPVTSPNR